MDPGCKSIGSAQDFPQNQNQPNESIAMTRKAKTKKVTPYSASDAVRRILRERTLSTYDSPMEIAFDVQLLRGALNKCGPGNEILADMLNDKIAELAMGGVRMREAKKTAQEIEQEIDRATGG